MQHTRFERIRLAVEAYTPQRGWHSWAYEFLLFGFKQAWACLFGALMLALLLCTRFLWPDHAPIARYDTLTIAALGIQVAMLIFRLETMEEAKIILAFHIVGTVMELFKTSVGSWVYPEPSLLRIGSVPLFSGFMYASVGSYMARVWRIFDFRFTFYPSRTSSRALAALIYANFFTHHWLPDLRWLCFAVMGGLFFRTRVWFRAWQVHRWMPLLLGWFLVALFIWFAENLSTFSHAWLYPSQRDGWHMVPITKLGSWYLLMIISVVLVSLINHGKNTSAD